MREYIVLDEKTTVGHENACNLTKMTVVKTEIYRVSISMNAYFTTIILCVSYRNLLKAWCKSLSMESRLTQFAEWETNLRTLYVSVAFSAIDLGDIVKCPLLCHLYNYKNVQKRTVRKMSYFPMTLKSSGVRKYFGKLGPQSTLKTI